MTTICSINVGYGQVVSSSISDSITIWYHGEFNKNKSKIEYPLDPIDWVNDFEHLFTNSEIYVLDSMISTFEKQTTIEIAILTVDSSFVKPEEFDNMVTTMARIWGVGKKDKNNGLIIGISATLRKIRISTGLGIEKILSDVEAKNIIEEIIIPEFKNANFYQGIKNALIAIITKLT